jgi:nucleoid-associated protein EbfC
MNLAKMMQQAQQMQAKLADMQSRMADTEVTGTAGGGAVSITMNGKGIASKVQLDASMMDDKDMLEDLIVAAINDARAKIEAVSSAEGEKLMGGMALPPGLKLPF